MMDLWKLWLLLLLPLCVCFDHEVSRVRTSGTEPYVAPLCSIAALHKDSMIRCRISTEMERGAVCLMPYRQGQDFESDCDPRFTVVTVNQTVYLHLASLTPADSGNYTCRCPYPGAIDTLFLHLTVEGPSSSSRILITATTLTGCAFITLTGLIFGRKLRKKYFRDDRQSGACELRTRGSPFSVNQDDPDDAYTSLQEQAGDYYQTVLSVHQQHDKWDSDSNVETAHWDEQEIDEREAEMWGIYENA